MVDRSVVVDTNLSTSTGSMGPSLPPIPHDGPHHSMTSSRQLPVPICQVPFDTQGVPTAAWAPDPGQTGLPHFEGIIAHHPQRTTLTRPLPGSALNLSATAHTQSDECRDASSRGKGKEKACEIPEEEDGSDW